MEIADDSLSQSSDEGLVLIRINVPDLGLQKCMQFHRDELVWDVKQQILAALPKELKESFNYGLFCPPQNGKAGKFLDEERPLSNYPLAGPIGYLELKYKRRIYKMLNIDEKQIKQLHTKANLRRMLDYVQNGHVEKASKLCNKGLDANFHCPETGETPLTLAASLKKSSRMLIALVNGGALLDYRTRDGSTAMHRAVEKNNHEAIKTLLDLGASPNYRDNKGLTPLYYTVLHTTDPHICELLLHDHAHTGAQDCQGWQEVHVACRNGLVQHLEHMLFYGADMNSRNASGNTPLHVCAVNDQESCARVLLFRGAEKEALNYANQTPYQVAVIAGNLALAEVIQKHRPEDVVLFREAPRFNPRRRSSSASGLSRTHSDPRLELTLGLKPPGPSPSNGSLPPFSSASSLSETSTGSSSTCTQPSLDDSEDTAVTDKSNMSDSSGVCVSNSGNSYEQYREKPPLMDGDLSAGMVCVCLEPYNAGLPDHLVLSPGDIIEVTAVLESGILEGRTKTQQGLFPTVCVQGVGLRNPDAKPPGTRVEGRRETNNRVQSNIRCKKFCEEPRTVILHKGKKGYGFVLRGAKAASPLMEMQPSDNCPALQYLDDVDKGGVADLAGLRKGDYLLAINGEDVSQASHEHVVNLIGKAGDLVAMTVVTVHPPGGSLVEKPPSSAALRQCSTLPRKLMRGKAPAPPRRDPRTTLSVGRARARSMVAGLAGVEALNQTLQQQYETEQRAGRSSSIGSLPCKPATAAGETQQVKTASIRARPASKRLTAAELEEILARQGTLDGPTGPCGVPGKTPKVCGSVAEMKRCRAGRHGDSRLHKEFSSTPDLIATDIAVASRQTNNSKRRARSQENVAALNARNTRHSWAFSANVHPRFIDGRDLLHAWGSDENLYEKSTKLTAENVQIPIRVPPRGPPPPPTHPPPPPPLGQVVKVDVSRARSEYANVTVDSKPAVMSSFRPPDGGKVYASPEEVAYGSGPKLPASLRSCSLPAKLPPPPPGSSASNTSSETESSGDSTTGVGGGYSSFKQPPYTVAPDTISTDGGNSSERSHPPPPAPPAPHSVSTNPYAQPFRPFAEERYPAEKTEPFIPDPDYDLSEDDDDDHTPTPQNPPTIPPPPKIYEKPPIPPERMSPALSDSSQRSQRASSLTESNGNTGISPHKDAKKAIVEARDRLRSVQNKNAENNGLLERRDSTGSEKAPPVLERRDSAVSLESEGSRSLGADHSDGGGGSQSERPTARTERRGSGAKKPPVPIPKQPKSAAPSGGATTPRSDVAGSPDFKQLVAQKVAERQGRVTTPETERPAGIPNDMTTADNAVMPAGSAEKKVVTNVRETISVFEKRRETGKPPASSPMRIPKRSDSERTRTRSQVLDSRDLPGSPLPLKMSKSCPTDLSQEEMENSSSGVSSDVGGPSDTPGGMAESNNGQLQAKDELDSDDSDDPQDRAWLLRARLTETDLILRDEIEANMAGRRTLTKNAVSLVKLPPPIESGETDAESDVADLTPSTRSPKRKEPCGTASMAAATTVLRGARTQPSATRPASSAPITIVKTTTTAGQMSNLPPITAPPPPVASKSPDTRIPMGSGTSLPARSAAPDTTLVQRHQQVAASPTRPTEVAVQDPKRSPPTVIGKQQRPTHERIVDGRSGPTIIEVRQGPPTVARARTTDTYHHPKHSHNDDMRHHHHPPQHSTLPKQGSSRSYDIPADDFSYAGKSTVSIVDVDTKVTGQALPRYLPPRIHDPSMKVGSPTGAHMKGPGFRQPDLSAEAKLSPPTAPRVKPSQQPMPTSPARTHRTDNAGVARSAPHPQSGYSYPQPGHPHPQSGHPHPHSGHPQPGHPHPQAGHLPHPQSGYPYPQSGHPHSGHPHSGPPHPQSGHPHPQSGQPHPQSGHPHPQSGHVHAQSGHPHSQSGHPYPQSGQQHPQAGHAHPQSKHPHPQSGHPHPQSGHPHPQSGHPHPQSGHPHLQSGHPHPQSGHPHPQSGHPHPQSGHPHPQSGHPHSQSGHPHPQSGHPYPQSGYPSHSQSGPSSRPPSAPASKKGKSGKTAPDAAELERSIEQSLELIKMHVDSLHEVNVLAGLVPPPPEFEGCSAEPVAEDIGMIAPPPEFSDDVHVPLADHLQELLLVATLPRHSSVSANQQAVSATGTLRNSKLALKLGYSTPGASQSGVSSSATSATSRLVRPKTLSTETSNKPKHSPEMKTPPGGTGGVCNGSVEGPTSKPPHPPEPVLPTKASGPKEFSAKPLQQWTSKDVSDWLESLFMPEYKGNFEAAGISGSRLATIDNSALLELGVKRVGHRLNMERSLRRHMSQK